MKLENFVIENFKGKRISCCYRKFGEYDLSHIPIGMRAQEADGITFIEFDGLKVFKFIPNAENFSFEIEEIDFDEWKNTGLIEVSKNDFWDKFLNREIIGVRYVRGGLGIMGLQFKFLDVLDSLNVLYIEESEYEFDALVIRSSGISLGSRDGKDRPCVRRN